jgi:hypothetical protein
MAVRTSARQPCPTPPQIQIKCLAHAWHNGRPHQPPPALAGRLDSMAPPVGSLHVARGGQLALRHSSDLPQGQRPANHGFLICCRRGYQQVGAAETLWWSAHRKAGPAVSVPPTCGRPCRHCMHGICDAAKQGTTAGTSCCDCLAASHLLHWTPTLLMPPTLHWLCVIAAGSRPPLPSPCLTSTPS